MSQFGTLPGPTEARFRISIIITENIEIDKEHQFINNSWNKFFSAALKMPQVQSKFTPEDNSLAHLDKAFMLKKKK